MRDGVVARGDVNTMLQRMGIQREGLIQFVVGALGPEMCNDVAEANVDWLRKVDDEEMRKKFTWFKHGEPRQAYWLALKE